MVTDQGPGAQPPTTPPYQTPPARPQGGESQQAASSQPTERPLLGEFKGTGNVRVRTLAGHEVVPPDTALPQFGAEGIDVTQDQADSLVEAFPEWVYVDDTQEEVK